MAAAGSIAFPLPKMNYFSDGRAMNPTKLCLSVPVREPEFVKGARSSRHPRLIHNQSLWNAS